MSIEEAAFDDLGRVIGARVRALRERRGWSIERLARATGGASSNIGNIERGQLPTLKTLLGLAVALEVTSIEELIGPVLPSSDWIGQQVRVASEALSAGP